MARISMFLCFLQQKSLQKDSFLVFLLVQIYGAKLLLRLDANAKCVYYLPRSSDATEPGTQYQLSDVKTTYYSSSVSVSILPED